MRRYSWFLLFLPVILFSACTSSKPATNSYVAPGYVKRNYSKILVLARLRDEIARKKVETSLSDLLNRSGYKGATTYNLITLDDLTTRERFLAKIDTSTFDAIIVLSYMGANTSVSGQTTVSSTTPIGSTNFFDIYTSPAYDFNYDTKAQVAGYVNASFFTKESYQKQWSSILQINLSNGLDFASDFLAGTALASMKRDKIL